MARRDGMERLLSLAARIDRLNERIGRLSRWLILACVLVSAANAVARYGFSVSSNAFLEIQWYLFAAVFLLAAGHTLRQDGHVRVDAVAGRFSPRARAWVDILGALFMLAPACLLLGWLGWEAFLESWRVGEVSADAGGLPRWPVKLLVPAAFLLLLLQGLAETIRRVAFLRGQGGTGAPEQPREER